MRLEMVGVSY